MKPSEYMKERGTAAAPYASSSTNVQNALSRVPTTDERSKMKNQIQVTKHTSAWLSHSQIAAPSQYTR